jgi:pSer/pThr/pTyr-binding forkhead associated (FHA) protein
MTLRLDDASVTHHHATLDVLNGAHTVTDHGSLNGTVVAGIRLVPERPRLVRAGQLVLFGSVWVELKRLGAPETEQPWLEGSTNQIALGLAEKMLVAGSGPFVRIVEGERMGQGLHLADMGRAYTVGRGEECDLVLNDAEASRVHASIERRAGKVFLLNAGATNGLTVGKRELGPGLREEWRAQEQIKLGTTVLALELPPAIPDVASLIAPQGGRAGEAQGTAVDVAPRSNDNPEPVATSLAPAEEAAALPTGGMAPVAEIAGPLTASPPKVVQVPPLFGVGLVVIVAGGVLVVFVVALLVMVFLPQH